jgi:hypothetical protein
MEMKVLLDEICTSIRNNDVIAFKKLLSAHPELINTNVYPGTTISQSLLHYAAREPKPEICMHLIDNGIDINVLDYQYRTPLHYLASAGDINLVKAFVSKGALIDGDSRCASSPMIAAAWEGHNETIEYSIECGADINRLQTKHNRTALDISQAYGHDETAKLLKSKNALKAQEEINFATERASGILLHVVESTGWVLSPKLTKDSIDLRTALIEKDKKNKVLFTIGVFQKSPHMELFLCIPFDWPVNNQMIHENHSVSFPVQLLFTLAEYRLGGGEIYEGYVVDKHDPKWSLLVWPGNIDGFIAVDYAFGEDDEPDDLNSENDNVVKLLLLVPIKYPKTGCPKGKKLEDWIEKRRIAKWAKNALQYSDIN